MEGPAEEDGKVAPGDRGRRAEQGVPGRRVSPAAGGASGVVERVNKGSCPEVGGDVGENAGEYGDRGAGRRGAVEVAELEGESVGPDV